MDSDCEQQQYQHHFQNMQTQFHHQKQQVNSLTRFRSAPSSYFASFLDAATDTVNNSIGGGGGGSAVVERGEFSNARPLSPETENIFARFMSKMDGENNSSSAEKLYKIPEISAVQREIRVEVKQEIETVQHQQQQQSQGHYNPLPPQIVYQSHSKPPLASQKSSGADSSFRAAAAAAATSIGMDAVPQMGNNNGSSGLTRHSSSPAGFFADLLNISNGYGVLKGMGNYGGGNSQMNHSSGQPSSTSGLTSQNSDYPGKRFSSSATDSNYMAGYPMGSLDDSVLSENFSSLDRGGGDDGMQTFSELNASEYQIGEGRNRPPLLSHHLSLPKTAAEMLAMENLMEFQDTVPCRIRAKRGCATHPRSIAERVRRTKISDRMRKLQDLVPNMDKQTNTADMLDLAVEYIKGLQNQVKTLEHDQANCTCPR